MRKAWLCTGLFALWIFPSACGDSSDSGGGGTHTGGKGGAGTGGKHTGGTSSGGKGGTSTGGTSTGGTSTGGTSTGGTAGTSSGGTAGTSSGGTAGTSSGGSAGTACGTYTTNFSGTENPISEGGVWTNGGDVGLDWQNIEKDQGLAFGTGFSPGYNDCIAHLQCFSPNHYAQATLHVQSGYTPPDSHEVELLVRFKITANSARGYEINNGWNGAYSQIVRWNGALNDFTYLNTTGPGFGALVSGDVIRAEAVGDTITVFKNGNQVMQATDSTWSDGNPGMGFFIRPGNGAVPKNYGFSSYEAGNR